MSAIEDYAKERDAAFIEFVKTDDFAVIDALTDRWGLKRLPRTDTGRAAVYKAVQECADIPAEVKAEAFAKCALMGFMPWADFEKEES